jgi:hypothetical protein
VTPAVGHCVGSVPGHHPHHMACSKEHNITGAACCSMGELWAAMGGSAVNQEPCYRHLLLQLHLVSHQPGSRRILPARTHRLHLLVCCECNQQQEQAPMWWST